jgi:zinc transporter ZupT
MFGMLLVSTDIMHSFVDGLAIGVSFQTSKSVGISTSIAVLLHEAPHLLGDFSILLRMGYTRLQLMLYCTGTIFASYVGSLLAFGLSSLSAKTLEFDGFRRGLLGFAAGNFLYIALADLVPEILQGRAERTSPELTSRQSSMSQLLCVASGSVIMFLIKKFE